MVRLLWLFCIQFTFVKSENTPCATKYEIRDCHCERYYDNERLIYTCDGVSFPETVSRLPNVTYKFYYIAHEKYILLGAANFTHLAGLRELAITPADNQEKQLKLLRHQTNVFHPLKKLFRLAINVVWELATPMPDLLQPLISLGVLDLSYTKKVNISCLTSTLHGLEKNANFEMLKLWNIQTLEFATLMGQTQLNLSSLLYPLRKTYLAEFDIGYNALQAIFPGINMYAKNLEVLSIENNMLDYLFETSFFIDIITHPSLNTVYMSNQGFGTSRQFEYLKLGTFNKHEKMAAFKSLYDYIGLGNSQNDINTNCTESMKVDLCTVFENVCEETRKFIMENISTCSLAKAILPSLFTGIPCDVIPPMREMLDANCFGCFIIPTTGSLEALNMNYLNIYDDIYTGATWGKRPICFDSKNIIQEIDMSGNSYTSVVELVSSDIRGLDLLMYLTISHLGLPKLNTTLGENFPKLTDLDLAQNQISFENQSTRIFQGMSQLEKLDLSSNEITALPTYTFDNLDNLLELNMSYNYLKTFEVSLINCSQLAWLDLRNNALETIPESVISTLETLAPTSWFTHIYLSNNNFLCVCENKGFLEWILYRTNSRIEIEDRNDLLCTDRHLTTIQMSTLTSTDLEDMCRGEHFYTFLSVGISLSLSFLLFTCCIFLYKKRWWFRYHVFLTRQMWKKYRVKGDANRHYRYDVFISYNDRDHFWVDDVLRPKLEDEHGIRLCLHLRDFMFGELITDQIIESIENSRHTLLILSPNFLASTWCHFEMQMAQNKLFTKGEDVLLLALLKPLPKVGVSKLLKSVMETKTYIEWTEDEDGQKLFWAKLVQAVKTPAEEPFDVSIEDVTENANLTQQEA